MKYVLAIDLAQRDAMAAAAEIWAWKPQGAGLSSTMYWVDVHYWWCMAALKRRAQKIQDKFLEGDGQMPGWARDPRSNLNLAAGNEINMDSLATFIVERVGLIDGLAYDPYKFIEIIQRLIEAKVDFYDALAKNLKAWQGIPLYKHPQTSQQFRDNPLWIGNSYEMTVQALSRKNIFFRQNPILNWNVSCGALAFDKLDNPYYTRPSGDNLIDGLTGFTMGIGLANLLMNPIHKEAKAGF